MTEAFGDEPEHNDGVEQHAEGRGALNRWRLPALRFLDAEMLLGVAKGDLDAPPHRVPGDNLLGFVPRGLNRLSPPTASLATTRSGPFGAAKIHRFPLIVMLRKGCLPPSEPHLVSISALENQGPPQSQNHRHAPELRECDKLKPPPNEWFGTDPAA